MRITLKVDNTGLLAKLKNSQKRIRYAVKNALNETALVVQAAQRQDFQGSVQVRSEFAKRRVSKIITFASLTRPYVVLGMDTAGTRLLIQELEEGGTKTPRANPSNQFDPQFAGSRFVPVPLTGSKARPAKARRIQPSWKPSALGLKRSRGWGGSKSGVFGKPGSGPGPWRGERKSFFMPGVGIEIRTGKGRGLDKRKIVWYSRPGGVHLPRALHWYGTAQKTAERAFQLAWKRAIVDAFRHQGLV